MRHCTEVVRLPAAGQSEGDHILTPSYKASIEQLLQGPTQLHRELSFVQSGQGLAFGQTCAFEKTLQFAPMTRFLLYLTKTP